MSNGNDLNADFSDAVTHLIAEILAIAETGNLPDGDGVNIPTLLWAEEWRDRLRGLKKPNVELTGSALLGRRSRMQG